MGTILAWIGFVISLLLLVLLALHVAAIPVWVPYALIAAAFAVLLFDRPGPRA